MGILDRLFGKEKSLSHGEKEALNSFTRILTKTSEPVRLKGKDLLPEFGKRKLPGNIRSAMMCIIREGEKPPNVIEYLKQLFVKYPDAVIFEDLDIYFHAYGNLQLPKDEESLIPILLSDKKLIEMFYFNKPDYYGPPDNIKFKVISDHTNQKILSYNSYK